MGDVDLNRGSLAFGAEIVLSEPLSDFTYPRPDDRIIGSVVIVLPAKYLDPDGALFQRALPVLSA
jgi:hypothetical protein